VPRLDVALLLPARAGTLILDSNVPCDVVVSNVKEAIVGEGALGASRDLHRLPGGVWPLCDKAIGVVCRNSVILVAMNIHDRDGKLRGLPESKQGRAFFKAQKNKNKS